MFYAMQSRSEPEVDIAADGRGAELAEEPPGESDLSWQIACSLLKADSYTTRALEEHVFRMSRSDADNRSTAEYLEEAIDRHEEIVQELQYALGAVDSDGPGGN
jgi:hypothetical protein